MICLVAKKGNEKKGNFYTLSFVVLSLPLPLSPSPSLSLSLSLLLSLLCLGGGGGGGVGLGFNLECRINGNYYVELSLEVFEIECFHCVGDTQTYATANGMGPSFLLLLLLVFFI